MGDVVVVVEVCVEEPTLIMSSIVEEVAVNFTTTSAKRSGVVVDDGDHDAADIILCTCKQEISLEIDDHDSSESIIHVDIDDDQNMEMNMQQQEDADDQKEQADQDDWLPITESRSKGNSWKATFHLVCSGIGSQALMLPFAFVFLGWFWGILCLSVAFVWQLYTIWLLVNLHESLPGTRYSRYLHLSMAAFGGKFGKVLSVFPVMYLSGGTCVMLIITGGGMFELFYKAICGDDTNCIAKTLTGTQWFLVFTCLAISVALLCPNLNSLAGVSLVGAATAVACCTVIWALSVGKDRPTDASQDPLKSSTSNASRIRDVLNGLGIIALAFRGHNVVLEIQGTLPSRPKQLSVGPMWRGVKTAYLLIAACLFPIAIGGYWAYGNMISANGDLMATFTAIHGADTSKSILCLIYALFIVRNVCMMQIYLMPILDNIESKYTSRKNKKCPRRVQSAIRVLLPAFMFFIAVAFPFLGSLGPLIGGITLPLTFAYPCFMWIAIKKPRVKSKMWELNFGLGCLGVGLSVILAATAAWSLASKGLNANFFKPR